MAYRHPPEHDSATVDDDGGNYVQINVVCEFWSKVEHGLASPASIALLWIFVYDQGCRQV